MAGVALGRSYGVAKSATLHPVKVLNDNAAGLYSWVIQGLYWWVIMGLYWWVKVSTDG